jgi:hypothetical protein
VAAKGKIASNLPQLVFNFSQKRFHSIKNLWKKTLREGKQYMPIKDINNNLIVFSTVREE